MNKLKKGSYVIVKKEANDYWYGIGKIETIYLHSNMVCVKMLTGNMRNWVGGFGMGDLIIFKDKKTALDTLIVEEL